MFTIRATFKKQGEACYISHLDLQRAVTRALKCTRLPIWYTQGFNPHMYVTFALPLPITHEGQREFFDFKLDTLETPNCEQVVEKLNIYLPHGFVVTSAAPPVFDAREIALADYEFIFEQAQSAKAALNAFCEDAQALVVKENKKGGQQSIALKEHVQNLVIGEQNAQGKLVATLRLPAGNVFNINPNLFVNYLEERGVEKNTTTVIRKNMFTKDGKQFA